VIGSEETVRATSESIRELTFQQYSVPGQPATLRLVNTLSPTVLSKTKNRSGKGVDIQMTVDILSHVYQNNADTIYLVSGDGDYAPVLLEARRMGKQVFVAALSSGLSPKLRLLADRFIDLDTLFFNRAKVKKSEL
jgi:uncharacterized protein (TIGR00288 family)